MKRQDDLPTFAGLRAATPSSHEPRDAARSLLSGNETLRAAAGDELVVRGNVRHDPRGDLSSREIDGDRAGNEFDRHHGFRSLRVGPSFVEAQAAVSHNARQAESARSRRSMRRSRMKTRDSGVRDIVEAAANVYNEKLPFGAPGYFPAIGEVSQIGRVDQRPLPFVRRYRHPLAQPIASLMLAERCPLQVWRMTQPPLSAGIALVSVTVTLSIDIKWRPGIISDGTKITKPLR